MDFEGLENWRAKLTEKTMIALVDVVEDKEFDVKDRIAAAKVVDVMSDSIIKARILTEQTQTADNAINTMSKQLKKLDD